MNQTLRISLISLGVVLVAGLLLGVGVLIGRSWLAPAGAGYEAMMMGSTQYRQGWSADGPASQGMMGPNLEGNNPYGYGMMGSGMMGPGMRGSGMMGSLGAESWRDIDPITIEQAEQSVQDYIGSFNNDDLELGEIMVFDNHAYAQIVEQSTGLGAMEVLVDPVTGGVYPEFGPNMMWNLKYSPMTTGGMMGMMRGYPNSAEGYGMMGPGMMDSATDEEFEAMVVSEQEAIEIAQRYLDFYSPGVQADDHADPFYGYYTIHIEKDGDTVGMLSVNGFTREVWLHNWHGELVEVAGEDH